MNSVQKKILLVGDFGVGKSSLVERYVNDRFSEEYKSTIGVVIQKKSVEIDGEMLNLLIWDVAGSREIAEVPESYYLGCSGILYIFDLSRPETWAGLRQRLATVCGKSKIEQGSNRLMVIANKSDLCDENNLKHVLSEVEVQVDVVTSAKSSLNVDEAFMELSRRILAG
ncbi:MAG: GTP-binding protein [Acidiferrobacterales bacterium]|nr:GTP-binding protein [Acidiferrobacterales bacterium]